MKGAKVIMDFKTIVNSRYAVKKFDGRKLSGEKVQELLELVRLAPSSFNIQPWIIRVVDDQAMKEKLVAAAWNQPQVSTCSHLLVFCANTDIKGCIDQLEQQLSSGGNDVSAYVQMMRNFENNMTPEHKKAWAQRQVYLALGNALNGAKALGFDSCPMEGFDSKAFAEILAMPDHIVPTALCPIGYAADEPGPKTRFPLSNIIHK